MISYRFPEEKEFIVFFAKRIGEPSIITLLETDAPLTEKNAEEISHFFWKMIDSAVELESKEDSPWSEGCEFWTEKVMYSLMAHLKQLGYGDVWNRVLKSQNE